MDEGIEPIEDDEWLLRTVSPRTNRYFPEKNIVDSKAFRPHHDPERDGDGLSLSRKKHITPQELVNLKYGESYYVFQVKAGHLRNLGMQLEPDPIPDNPGHMIIPNLNTHNRGEDRQETWQNKIADEVCEYVGFFEANPDDSNG